MTSFGLKMHSTSTKLIGKTPLSAPTSLSSHPPSSCLCEKWRQRRLGHAQAIHAHDSRNDPWLNQHSAAAFLLTWRANVDLQPVLDRQGWNSFQVCK
jgi:hypothetical protein